jgi:hypothetical protein
VLKARHSARTWLLRGLLFALFLPLVCAGLVAALIMWFPGDRVPSSICARVANGDVLPKYVNLTWTVDIPQLPCKDTAKMIGGEREFLAPPCAWNPALPVRPVPPTGRLGADAEYCATFPYPARLPWPNLLLSLPPP